MRKTKLPTKPDPKAAPAVQLAQALYEYLKGPLLWIPEKWQEDNAALLEPLLAKHKFALIQAVRNYLFAAEEHWVDVLLREKDQVPFFVKHFTKDMLVSYRQWLAETVKP